MLTIYYHPKYWKRDRVYFTKSLKHSKIINFIEIISWKLSMPISNNLIFNGPQKLINNLLLTFKDSKKVTFNDKKYKDSYVVQFDDFGEKIVNELLAKDKNTKIIIGPLYNFVQLKKIEKLIHSYDNIKLAVASEVVKNGIMTNINFDISDQKIVILPVGIEINDIKRSKFEDKTCLIYFKKRSSEELKSITSLLKTEIPWFIDVEFENKLQRSKAIQMLANENIETRLSYPPLSQQSYLSKYKNNDLKFSESIYEKLLWMPSSINLKLNDVKRICKILGRTIEK